MSQFDVDALRNGQRITAAKLLIEQRAYGTDTFYWVASTDHRLRSGDWQQLADGQISVCMDVATPQPVKIEVRDEAARSMERLLGESDLDRMTLPQLLADLTART